MVRVRSRKKAPRQCSAHSKQSGKRCGRVPIAGGMVCYYHGGAAKQVKRKAAERILDMLAEAIDPDNSMREAARLAYSDIRMLFDEHGKLLPVKDWPEDIARAVASVEVVRGNVDQGDGKFDDVVKLKLWDKVRPLESLMKHHGQLKEQMEHSGALEIRWKGEE